MIYLNSYKYEELVDSLFTTKAVKVCEKNNPFWYTSNKIGPYYINTHFLFGNEEKANSLLKFIDNAVTEKETCSEKLLTLTLDNYESDPIYKNLIDNMISYIHDFIGTDTFEYVSGGERRDWFFSLIIAYKLEKPHLTLFKDLSQAVYLPETVNHDICTSQTPRMLHIADIITEASSYTRAWIPAVRNFGGTITKSLVVIDRLQGGKENLNANGVESHALANADSMLFDQALQKNLIDSNQYSLVLDFIQNPYDSMRSFLINHPEFLEEALNSDPRTAMRAKICVEEDLYNLNKL